ncbi:Drug/Metabolite Transporter (DMT) Superfamily [Thraustotheca clavata]|uniref:Drug/Metabolite Transporter (DMT) Superfamily n=1 Tax=Thraustotheca clavata TaxID=74557 RepID=A0A1V9ZD81_9STRA|nr:Drug/Metabolite Transporter (DMT) Superfamily [Thraustotheca clavata]
MAWKIAGVGAAALAGGAMATMLMKMQFSWSASGTELCLNGTTTLCPFSKPWFGVLQMKIGMTMSLIFLLIRKRYTKSLFLETPVFKRMQYGVKYMPQPRTYDERRYLLQQAVDGPSWHTLGLTVIPAAMDLVQTMLSFIGLLWIPASVYQMSSGCVVVFSAIFAVRLMGLKIQRYQILSIAIMVVSIIIVSIAGIVGEDNLSPKDIFSIRLHHVFKSDWNQVVGMSMILVAQVIFSAQLVVEEHFLNQLQLSPFLLVGMEGLWGLVLFIPLIQFLKLTPEGTSDAALLWHESFPDTWTKLSNSPFLCLLVVSYTLCIGAYQITALYITKHHSALVRSMIEIGRTIGVWALGFVVYYIFNWSGPSSPGEKFSTWTLVEFVGFLLMAIASLTYKQLLHFPSMSLYQDDNGLPVTVEISSFMLDRH